MSYRNLRLKKLNRIANNYLKEQQKDKNGSEKNPATMTEKINIQSDINQNPRNQPIDFTTQQKERSKSQLKAEKQPEFQEKPSSQFISKKPEAKQKTKAELEAIENAELKKHIDDKWNEFYPNLTNKRNRRNNNDR